MLDGLLAEIRPTLRSLRRNPGFALFAILTLALGIGANTAIFSVADAFIFKPLPYSSADRLVMIHARAPGDTTLASPVSPADYLDIQSRSTSFDRIAAFEQVDFNLAESGSSNPEAVYSTNVTPDFFATLGVQPLLGRAFGPGDDLPGNNQVAVLSYGLWQDRFAADPTIIGRRIKLNGRTFSVIGVMGKAMRFPAGSRLWAPLTLTPQEREIRETHSLRLLGRLKPGATEPQARSELGTIMTALARTYPRTNQGWSAFPQPLHRYITGELTSQFSLLLLGAVFFVLLIACANVMSLQFARISGRQRELALRAALGASRWRIIREIAIENILLSLAAAAVSLIFSAWSLDVILSYMPGDVVAYIAGWDNIQLDARALAFTVAAALFGGLLSGVIPALRTRPDVNDALKEGGRSATLGRGRTRSRGILVVAQIAAACVLLAGAGLMLRGSHSLLDVNQSLRPASILTMQLVLTDKNYGQADQRTAFYDRMLDRLSILPGVEAATLVSNAPYGVNEIRAPYTVEGQLAVNASERKSAQLQVISPNYLDTLGIRLIAGRAFSQADGPKSQPVAIVSEKFATRNWPTSTALGRHIRLSNETAWLTVVGVVKDVRYDPWVTEAAPTIYQPYRQAPLYYTYIAIRGKGDPLSLAAPARQTIAALDIERPLFELKTLDRVISNKIIGLSYVAVMLAVLGAIAIILSAAGIYSLMAYLVTERTHEIGIRLALGAGPQEILRGMLLRSGSLILAGLTIGLGISIPLARLLSSLIYGVAPNDPTTYAGAALLLVIVALTACYVPARRAMSVNPIIALRRD
ncbi:MAG TPA: ABC transporter permease [Bryobacteraceae bacterium]